MSVELVKKMVEDVWNKHNLNAVKDFFHPNAVIHGAHSEIKGIEGIKKFIQELFSGIPDIEYKVDEIFAAGNKVVVRWTGKGTHKGELLENPASNKKIQYSGITIHLIENNKIKESWFSADLFGLLKQIGAFTHTHT